MDVLSFLIGKKHNEVPSIIVDSLSVTDNGTYTAELNHAYNPVSVNVQPPLQSKNITPSEMAQTISPDEDYYGLSEVEIGAISSTYIGSGVPTKVAATYTPTTTDQTIAADQYLTGAQTVKGDANLLAENIKKDVTIFGVDGSYEGSGGGGSSVPRKDVNFIDYDGTVLYAYTALEFAELDAMPANPTHQGLTAQGWNWTLADAKTYVAASGALNIGQMYTTADGKTRLYITIPSNAPTYARTLGLKFSNGYDSPWPAGGGKNKFNGTFLQGYCADADGKWVNSPNWIATEKIPCKASTSYTVSADAKVTRWQGFVWYDSNGDFISTDNLNSNVNIGLTKTSPSNAAYLIFNIAGYPGANDTIAPSDVTYFQLEEGSSSTAYAPYSNITSGGVTVDYGDGSTAVTVTDANVSLSHDYTDTGDYVITLTVNSGTVQFNDKIFDDSDANANRRPWLKRLEIGSSLTSIGSSAFYNCYGLRSVTIPNTVTSIGNSVFTNCFRLQSVTIPNTVTSIGNSAFTNCYGLRSVTISNIVTSIGIYTFAGCSGLQNITIPNTVTSIGSSVFTKCFGLRAIHFKPTTPPIVDNSNAWDNLQTSCKIYVPTGKLSDYTGATNYPSSSTYTYVEE